MGRRGLPSVASLLTGKGFGLQGLTGVAMSWQRQSTEDGLLTLRYHEPFGKTRQPETTPHLFQVRVPTYPQHQFYYFLPNYHNR